MFKIGDKVKINKAVGPYTKDIVGQTAAVAPHPAEFLDEVLLINLLADEGDELVSFTMLTGPMAGTLLPGMASTLELVADQTEAA